MACWAAKVPVTAAPAAGPAPAPPPNDVLLLLLMLPDMTAEVFDVATVPAAATFDADDGCFVPDDWGGLVLLLFGDDDDDGAEDEEDDDDNDDECSVVVVRLDDWSAPVLSGAFG